MVRDMRNRFWICLIFTVPIFVYAPMFTECSLVMFVIQAIVFSPWFKPDTTRWLIAPALSVLAAGLFLVPWAFDFTLMLL